VAKSIRKQSIHLHSFFEDFKKIEGIAKKKDMSWLESGSEAWSTICTGL
jgi:hypothetical protein